MKIILLIASCWLGIHTLGLARPVKLTPAIQRTLARELATIVVDSGMSPLRSVTDNLRPYMEGYRHEITRAFAQEPHILASYLQLLVEHGDANIDMPALARHIETVMNTVGESYAEQQEGVSFKWRDAQHIMEEGLKAVSYIDSKQREGDISLRHLYDSLRNLPIHNKRDKELQTVASDAYEYLSHYPQFDHKITNRELSYLLDYARNEHTTVVEIKSEIVKITNHQADALFDLRRKQLTIFDLATPSNYLGEFIQNIVDDGELFLGESGLQELSNKLAYSVLPQDNIEGLPLNFGITFDQLFEKRFLSGITNQFLWVMNWSWHEFSNMLYPNDSKQAAMFIADYNNLILNEATQELVYTVLQAERDKLSETQKEKATAIDDFLNEIPTLTAKEMFMKLSIITLTDDDSTFTDEQGQEKMALLQEADNYYKQNMSRWNYLHLEMLLNDMPLPYAVLNFLRAGFSPRIIERKILTPPITDKLAEGGVVTEQDINNLRRQINEENLQTLVAQVVKTKNSSPEEILTEIEWSYYLMPTIVQRDGFLRKIAQGISSNQNLLEALEKVEEDSFYYPIAVRALHEADSLGKRKRKIFLNKIRGVIRENKKLTNDMLKFNKAIGLPLPELPEGTPTQGELPVELPSPEMLRQQKKLLRNQRREKQRAKQPAKPEVVETHETAEERKQKAQHAAHQQAERELALRITKLSNMIGKTSLPTDTPVWLRLLVIINYAGTAKQHLVQRADLKNMQDRFRTITANDATTLPTPNELTNITLALEKHIRKRKNMLPPERSRILDNIRTEMLEIKEIVATRD